MKYSYNWLKELSGTKLSTEELAKLLMMHAFEVEEIEPTGSELVGVVAGKILDIQKHPDADKLQMTKVDIGDGKVYDIVCGAHNISVGDIVPVAKVGTKLPGGIEIKEASIRGEKSCGMLCAEDELGLGTDHSGIIILDKDLELGLPVAGILGTDDFTMEVKVLPDRSHDALSHVGLAREICVLEGREFSYAPAKFSFKETTELKVKIEDGKICPRYIGAVVDGIVIQDSPMWIKSRLKKFGMKPINNVVDATNYVMLETGQPLHAFDAEKIGNMEIIVRNAKKDELVKILDGTEQKLDAQDIVIADANHVLAIAGIMGGELSGIGAETKKIVVESANFDAVSIRKTKTRLNMQTDSAYRFEKEIDPNLAEQALARILEILQTFGGQVSSVIDVYPKKVSPWKIDLDIEYVGRLLGKKIPAIEIVRILNLLGIKTVAGEKEISAGIPTIRIDLKTQEDLIEEIGRVYGYENITGVAPKVSLKAARINKQREFERKTKDLLVGNGFSEVLNYSFYGQREVEMAGLSEVKHFELEKPLSPEYALMRTSLVPDMLKNIKENLRNFKNFNIFEIGRVYFVSVDGMPKEKKVLVGAIVLEKDKEAEIFFTAKGYVDSLLEGVGISGQNYDSENFESSDVFSGLWHQGRRAVISIEEGENALGHIGEVDPIVLANFGVKKRVAMFEFDLDILREKTSDIKAFRLISKYPTVLRDVSLLASSKELRVADIIANIKKSGGNLVLDVELFDIFKKEAETSYAFHIEFGDETKTLQSAEVDALMQEIIASLESDLGLSVRK